MQFPGESLVIKMWETLTDKGIGSLLKPWQMGREGRLRNELRSQEILMLAQAEATADKIRKGELKLEKDGTLRQLSMTESDPATGRDIAERIEPKLDFNSLANASLKQNATTAAREEINVSKAIIYAEEQLATDSQTPSSQSIEDDWMFRWRNYTSQVSTEELQRLWGSVLAGEVKSPGTYSYRTLEFLKGISKSEAEKIAKLARFVINGRLILRSQKDYLDTQGINFSTLLEMQELGIIGGVEALGLTYTQNSYTADTFTAMLASHGKGLLIKKDEPKTPLILEAYVVTNVGRQIFKLGHFEPDLEYLKLAGKEIIRKGFSVSLVDWQEISSDEGRYFNEIPIES